MRKPPLRHGRPSAAYPVQQHGYYSVNEGDGSAILAGDESFADLFAASLNSPRKAVARRDPELGELVQGEIIQIGTDFAFLDIGGKSEAMISLDELRGDDGNLTVRVGDKLEGHVVSVGGKEGGLIISGRVQRGAGLSDQLRQAFLQAAPVQGLVTGANKGGLEIDLGGVRAFLPSSQIDLRYCQDHTVYIGRALTLRVIRFDEESRTVIVSRRAVLEVDLRPLAEATKARLKPGAVFQATLVAVQEPMAIADMGGIDGMVPTADILTALRAVGRNEDTIKLGQRVEVEVSRIDQGRTADPYQSCLQGNLRISLVLRSLLADPLDEMLGKLTEGERVTGRIVRLEPFGAFVELQPAVEGLIHISAMSERHITHPREILALGQEVTATVISLDRDRRRIGLSLIEEIRAAQAAVAATLTVGSRMRVRIERVEPNGALVRVIVPDVAESTFPRGLIPNSELGVPRGSDIKRLFPVAREYVAAIQNIDGEGRVRLSLRVAAEQEQAEAAAAAEAARVAAAQQAAAREQAAAEEAAAASAAKKKSRPRKAPAAPAPVTEVVAAEADSADSDTKKRPAARRSKSTPIAPGAAAEPAAALEAEAAPSSKSKRSRAPGSAVESTPNSPPAAGGAKAKASRKKSDETPTAEHVAAPVVDASTAAVPGSGDLAEANRPSKRRVRKTA